LHRHGKRRDPARAETSDSFKSQWHLHRADDEGSSELLHSQEGFIDEQCNRSTLRQRLAHRAAGGFIDMARDLA